MPFAENLRKVFSPKPERISPVPELAVSYAIAESEILLKDAHPETLPRTTHNEKLSAARKLGHYEGMESGLNVVLNAELFYHPFTAEYFRMLTPLGVGRLKSEFQKSLKRRERALMLTLWDEDYFYQAEQYLYNSNMIGYFLRMAIDRDYPAPPPVEEMFILAPPVPPSAAALRLTAPLPLPAAI